MILVIEPTATRARIRAFGSGNNNTALEWEYTRSTDQDVRAQELRELLANLAKDGPLEAVSFRLLFGGSYFKKTVRIGKSFTATLGKLTGAFPLYIPPILSLIDLFCAELKNVPKFAFFETSIFSGLPAWEKSYPLANEYYPGTDMIKGGFHGIYHGAHAGMFGKKDKVVSVVMDRYTTVCAIKDGAPYTVSLGYTPLEGIMSLKSSGDVDPGIIVYLMKEKGYSMNRIDDILKNKSGFYGMTGYDLPPDQLITLYDKDPKVTLAFDVYINQILKYIGDSIAILHGLDSVIFAGQYVGSLGQVVYRLAKQMAFLEINLAELPWYTGTEFLRITSESSKRHFYINRLDETDIICRETQVRLGTASEIPIPAPVLPTTPRVSTD
jgi:acetate kinase